MNTKKIAYLLVFSLFLGVSSVAYGVPEDTRYLIKSNAGFWKNTLGVRNTFGNGFTTDLAPWQLRLTKIFGVEIEPVSKLYVLNFIEKTADAPEDVTGEVSGVSDENTVDEDSSDEPSNLDISGKGNGGPSKDKKPPGEETRPLPSDQIPWGIEVVYNDSLLSSTSGGGEVNVAVLDTGVLVSHLDLVNRVSSCKDFTQRRQSVIDGKCDDKNGHGTHIAGIIVADGGSDGKGIYGVAPEANLYAYKVCGNNGSCWADDIANAIRDASDNGAHIINLSLGSDSSSTLIKDAVTYAYDLGVLVVAASGNDGPYLGSIDYPASYASVVAVGAMDVGFIVPEWSSRGTNSSSEAYVVDEGDIEFAMPGVNIESTWRDGSYVILSGTSMASPHAAGLAAKLWQKDADNPAQSTRDILHSFSIDLLPAGDDDDSGWGLPRL